jgi:hypothetical protein
MGDLKKNIYKYKLLLHTRMAVESDDTAGQAEPPEAPMPAALQAGPIIAARPAPHRRPHRDVITSPGAGRPGHFLPSKSSHSASRRVPVQCHCSGHCGQWHRCHCGRQTPATQRHCQWAASGTVLRCHCLPVVFPIFSVFPRRRRPGQLAPRKKRGGSSGCQWPPFFFFFFSLKLYRVGLLYCECVGGDGPPPPQRQECGAESVGPTREYLE